MGNGHCVISTALDCKMSLLTGVFSQIEVIYVLNWCFKGVFSHTSTCPLTNVMITISHRVKERQAFTYIFSQKQSHWNVSEQWMSILTSVIIYSIPSWDITHAVKMFEWLFFGKLLPTTGGIVRSTDWWPVHFSILASSFVATCLVFYRILKLASRQDLLYPSFVRLYKVYTSVLLILLRVFACLHYSFYYMLQVFCKGSHYSYRPVTPFTDSWGKGQNRVYFFCGSTDWVYNILL